MVLEPSGLGTPGPGAPNTSRDFWLQTQPMPAGPSWRPPRIVSVTVRLVGAEMSGQDSQGFLRAWARYGADRVHWSSWFPLPGATPRGLTTEFTGTLVKPYYAPSRYQSLMSDWWRTTPAWSSDEHEYALWLAANHRDVFQSEIPVMGYVQVLVEGNAQRFSLKGVSIGISSSGSGLSSVDVGGTRPAKRTGIDDKWFFQLPIKSAESADAAAIRAAKSAIVRSMDSSLPSTSFEVWLRSAVGARAETKWEVNDCGEQTGNPKEDQGRDFPICAEARVTMSGKRTLSVSLAVGRLKGGVSGRPGFWSAYIQSADGSVQWIKSLAAVAETLRRGGRVDQTRS